MRRVVLCVFAVVVMGWGVGETKNHGEVMQYQCKEGDGVFVFVCCA